MTPARYYIAALAAAQSPGGAEHRWVRLGASGMALCWVRWDGAAARQAFEGRAGVHGLGTAVHPLPAAATSGMASLPALTPAQLTAGSTPQQILAAFGVAATDGVAVAIEKIAAVVGGMELVV